MNTTSLHIKLDNTIKTQAQQTADELGLSLSSVVKVLLKQLIRTRQLSVGLDEEPTEYFEQLMKEADEDFREGRFISFANGQEALDYLDKEIIHEKRSKRSSH